MSRSSPSLPPRVYIIAAVIVLALASLTWVLNRLGAPAGQLPTRPEPEPVVALQDPGPDGLEAVATPGANADVPALQPPSSDAPGSPPPGGISAVASEAITVQLYLAQEGSRQLSSQVRRIRAPTTLAAQAQLALQTLVRASQGPLPAGTVIREVWVSPGGVAYVDLAADFPKILGGGSLTEIHAVYGIVGTLTSSFPSIRSVQFLLNGQPVDTLNGHLDLSRPLTPLRDWNF